MREEFPDLKNGESCVLNLDDVDNAGSHFVSVIKKNDDLYYFDSFGVLPPTCVVNSAYKKLYFNTQDLQGMTSSVCGRWSILFIRHMSKPNARMIDFILDFDLNNQKNNDTKTIELT